MKPPENEAIVIAEHIRTFFSTHLYLQGNSQNTIKKHEQSISMYLHFLEKEKYVVPDKLSGDCFSKNIIEEWLLWMVEARKCSPQTCNVRLDSLRAFLKYLSSKEPSMLAVSKEASLIKRREPSRRKVVQMSKTVATALMAEPNTHSTIGLRDLALIAVMYETAARIEEILSLKIGSLYLDTKNPYVVVRNGERLRRLCLMPKTAANIKQYIKKVHGNIPNKDSFLFLSRNKDFQKTVSQEAINIRLMIYAAKVRKKGCHVPLDIHANQLRYAKALHLLEDGVDIANISILLGHEDIQTTTAYLDSGLERQANAMKISNKEKEKSDTSSLFSFCGVKAIKS